MWKTQSDPCFSKRAVPLSTQKSLSKSERESEEESSCTLPPPKNPSNFLIILGYKKCSSTLPVQ